MFDTLALSLRLLHPCFTLTSLLLHKFCIVNAVPSHGESILTQYKYPVLYDKSDKIFKDKSSKFVDLEDVA